MTSTRGFVLYITTGILHCFTHQMLSRGGGDSSCNRDIAFRLNEEAEDDNPGGGGSSSSSNSNPTTRKAADLVTEVLRRAEGTDRGASATPEQRAEIDALIEQVFVLLFLLCTLAVPTGPAACHDADSNAACFAVTRFVQGHIAPYLKWRKNPHFIR